MGRLSMHFCDSGIARWLQDLAEGAADIVGVDSHKLTKALIDAFEPLGKTLDEELTIRIEEAEKRAQEDGYDQALEEQPKAYEQAEKWLSAPTSRAHDSHDSIWAQLLPGDGEPCADPVVCPACGSPVVGQGARAVCSVCRRELALVVSKE